MKVNRELSDKFRKKSGTVEAFQYDGDLIDAEGNYYVPEWAVAAHRAGILFYMKVDSPEAPLMELYLCSQTQTDSTHVQVGGYVICNEDGSLDVCSAQDFERNYEATAPSGKSSGDGSDHGHEGRRRGKLQNYIGVKIVKTEQQEKDSRPRYKVLYPDGYVSWSPKDVFEKAYRILDCEDFINEDM